VYLRRFKLAAYATLALAVCAGNRAMAQRVRFGAPSEDAVAASGGDLSSSNLPDGSNWVSRTSAATPTSAPTTPIYVASVPAASSSPVYTWTTAPAGSASTLPSPASAYGSSIAAPQWPVSSWDPYSVAARPAFSGTITSASASGGYILPQPMPRVPYYTQQPVSPTNQPYTIIPEPSCAGPIVGPTSTIVAPGPTPPPVIVGPTIPTLTPALPPPPIYTTRWYVQADALVLTRDARIGNQPLVLLNGNAPTQSNVLLSTADFNFPFEVGPRILVGYNIDPYAAIEASYFGIYNWHDSHTIVGNNDLNLPGDLGLVGNLDFFNADKAVATYDSMVNNAELNYVHSFAGNPNLAWLIGFRYFELADKFNLTFTDNQTGSSAYKISSYNNLFGGQIGGRVGHACGKWGYDLTGKAGVYGNYIHSSQIVQDFSGFTERNATTTGGQLSFLGELGLNGNYEFSPNWSLRGGYQVYWVEGLALAPNQLDFTDTPTSGTTLNKTGGMFMQGAHAGLMARW
jgi:hypothetical protein